MIRRLVVLMILPIFVGAQQNDLITLPNDSEVKIIYVGDYKVGELDTTVFSNEWWGLYEKNNTSFLKKVKLNVEEIEPDMQYDWKYRIAVEDDDHCIVLISGLNLIDKSIKDYTSQDILREDNAFTFEFGPYHTYLSSELDTTISLGEVKRKDFSIHLNYETSNKKNTQELFLFPSYDSRLHVTLIWAGDLDGDGNTDFLINIPTPPYNEMGFSSGLFLSSRAEGKQLVKLVAYHLQRGC